VEPRGFEPLTSAVQRRPDESATVRLHPKCAANPRILVDDIGSSVRPVPLATAWVGVRLVSRLGIDRAALRRNAEAERVLCGSTRGSFSGKLDWDRFDELQGLPALIGLGLELGRFVCRLVTNALIEACIEAQVARNVRSAASHTETDWCPCD
jgi:hypothetical protein